MMTIIMNKQKLTIIIINNPIISQSYSTNLLMDFHR